jgi:hypothetical protein
MKLLTPRIFALLVTASILSLLLPLLPDLLISVVIFIDASVVSLLVPGRFVNIMARLVAVTCILLLALVIFVYKSFTFEADLFNRFPRLWEYLYLKCSLHVFLYGLHC